MRGIAEDAAAAGRPSMLLNPVRTRPGAPTRLHRSVPSSADPSPPSPWEPGPRSRGTTGCALRRPADRDRTGGCPARPRWRAPALQRALRPAGLRGSRTSGSLRSGSCGTRRSTSGGCGRPIPTWGSPGPATASSSTPSGTLPTRCPGAGADRPCTPCGEGSCCSTPVSATTSTRRPSPTPTWRRPPAA